eukprot:Seg1860.3 transcript_id=Seg1860.3/GoldUCD/mRNA.D3Y31 product=Aquaporin-9 protein_id=Seg1860.3/GoldUCD/D3Y31
MIEKLRGLKSPPLVRECLAEMMGTFILVALGCGSVAQFVLAKQAFGNYFSVDFGWGMGVAFGIYWAGGISGGHINPAVSLALAVCDRFPWRKLPFYMLAQFLGAFIACAGVFAVYHDYLVHFSDAARDTSGVNGTAGIYSTYPPDFVSNWAGFGDQLLATAIFVGTIFALLDNKNIGPGSNMAPLLIGLVVMTLGASFGINAGFGVNPARDLIPRVFTSVAGWGLEPFKAHNGWFWYPILGQFVGGVLGGLMYEMTIGIHHDTEEEEYYPEEKQPLINDPESNPEQVAEE